MLSPSPRIDARRSSLVQAQSTPLHGRDLVLPSTTNQRAITSDRGRLDICGRRTGPPHVSHAMRSRANWAVHVGQTAGDTATIASDSQLPALEFSVRRRRLRTQTSSLTFNGSAEISNVTGQTSGVLSPRECSRCAKHLLADAMHPLGERLIDHLGCRPNRVGRNMNDVTNLRLVLHASDPADWTSILTAWVRHISCPGSRD
jgi:hypothetical protein